MDPATKTRSDAPDLESLASSAVTAADAQRTQAAPSADAPELEYAGFLPRWRAFTLDGLLFAPVGWALERLAAANPGAGPWLTAAGAVVWFAYLIYCTGRYGRTLGKWAAGLEVRREDGNPVTWKAAWLRNAPLLIIVLLVAAAGFAPGEMLLDQDSLWALPPFLLLVAWVVADVATFFRGERRRALHDVLAGTVVVHDD